MRYLVKLLKTESGYAVWCPALRGCCFQGETETEALENIKIAIREYLEVVEELNQKGQSHYVDLEVGVA